MILLTVSALLPGGVWTKIDVKTMEGGETLNKGTAIFFGAIGIVFVSIVAAIGRSFLWW